MSTTTIHETELHAALDDMTGSADIIEAAFVPWDNDQLGTLETILVELAGLARLDDALLSDAA